MQLKYFSSNNVLLVVLYTQRVLNDNRRHDNNEPLMHLEVETAGVNAVGSTPPNQPGTRGAILAMEPADFHALEEAFNLPYAHFGPNQPRRMASALRFYTAASNP
jgi:hypothetical protein